MNTPEMSLNRSTIAALGASASDLQVYSSLILAAVLMLSLVLGGLANSWLCYLLVKQRLKFVKDTFAPFAIISDWWMCSVGSSAFILENVCIIALSDARPVYWEVGCLVKLTVTLFHVLMVTICFILHATGSVIENYYGHLAILVSFTKWRYVLVCLVWLLCIAIPLIYVAFLVIHLDMVQRGMPRCALDQFYLPVIFICFAAILICLSAMFAVVYRTRTSRRVFAANIRTSFVVNTGGEEKPCDSKQPESVPSSSDSNLEKHGPRMSKGQRSSELQTLAEESESKMKPKISLEIETSFLDPGNQDAGILRNRRPTPSPVRKFSFTATGCFSTSECLSSATESNQQIPYVNDPSSEKSSKNELDLRKSTCVDIEQRNKSMVESPIKQQEKQKESNDQTIASMVNAPEVCFVSAAQNNPPLVRANSGYKRPRDKRGFLSITSAQSSISTKGEDKLSISQRASDTRSSLGSFRSLPSKTSLRLSILNRISEDASYTRSHNSFSSRRDSYISQMTTADGHFETQDLSYTTVSWISIVVLLLSFLLEFSNSLFIFAEYRYTLTTIGHTMLYVAAAARPFIYIGCNKCLWKHLTSNYLKFCNLSNYV